MKVILVVAGLLLAAPLCSAYSFLTHETLIDIAWNSSIEPVLKSEYPNVTPRELREARACAYAGSTIQDAGYYPFGKGLFSDLTHYVRTGDFVTNLVRDARNSCELAFAMGAMSHYVGDTIGHRYAVNIAVPQEFPSLEKKYGPVVTYEEDEHAHVRTEFAFDVDQLSRSRFAPLGYLRHVGFRVPVALLTRAFYDTYGIPLRGVLGNEFAALNSYRWSVRTLLPRVGYAEVLLHRKSFAPDPDTPALEAFTQKLKMADQENNWDAYRKHKPAFSTRVLAGVIFIMPKIGPLSDLAIRGPKPDTEQDYLSSVNQANAEFAKLLGELKQEGPHKFNLADLDLDTGYATKPGTYKLTDETYAKLLHWVTMNTARPPIGLRQNILAYYSDPSAPIVTKRSAKKWKRVQDELAELKAMPATRIPGAK